MRVVSMISPRLFRMQSRITAIPCSFRGLRCSPFRADSRALRARPRRIRQDVGLERFGASAPASVLEQVRLCPGGRRRTGKTVPLRIPRKRRGVLKDERLICYKVVKKRPPGAFSLLIYSRSTLGSGSEIRVRGPVFHSLLRHSERFMSMSMSSTTVMVTSIS